MSLFFSTPPEIAEMELDIILRDHAKISEFRARASEFLKDKVKNLEASTRMFLWRHGYRGKQLMRPCLIGPAPDPIFRPLWEYSEDYSEDCLQHNHIFEEQFRNAVCPGLYGPEIISAYWRRDWSTPPPSHQNFLVEILRQSEVDPDSGCVYYQSDASIIFDKETDFSDFLEDNIALGEERYDYLEKYKFR